MRMRNEFPEIDSKCLQELYCRKKTTTTSMTMNYHDSITMLGGGGGGGGQIVAVLFIHMAKHRLWGLRVRVWPCYLGGSNLKVPKLK